MKYVCLRFIKAPAFGGCQGLPASSTSAAAKNRRGPLSPLSHPSSKAAYVPVLSNRADGDAGCHAAIRSGSEPGRSPICRLCGAARSSRSTIVDTLHGKRLADPYRTMRGNLKDPAVRDWFKGRATMPCSWTALPGVMRWKNASNSPAPVGCHYRHLPLSEWSVVLPEAPPRASASSSWWCAMACGAERILKDPEVGSARHRRSACHQLLRSGLGWPPRGLRHFAGGL